MDEETTGFWMVALGAATASGTWEGFRISPLRHTASLHVDGALTVKDDHPRARDYALVLSHPDLDGDRILVAGKGGTVEFGHDLVELLLREDTRRGPALWLADLGTGECSERCELPRAPRGRVSGEAAVPPEPAAAPDRSDPDTSTDDTSTDDTLTLERLAIDALADDISAAGAAEATAVTTT